MVLSFQTNETEIPSSISVFDVDFDNASYKLMIDMNWSWTVATLFCALDLTL